MLRTIEIVPEHSDQLDDLLRLALQTLQLNRIEVSGSGQIFDANNGARARIILNRPEDKPEALRILASAQIRAIPMGYFWATFE